MPRRSDVAVTGLQRALDRGDGLLRQGLVDPEAEGRHGHAVVRSQSWNAHLLDARPWHCLREGLLGQALAVPIEPAVTRHRFR
jgi:hypothetical protein